MSEKNSLTFLITITLVLLISCIAIYFCAPLLTNALVSNFTFSFENADKFIHLFFLYNLYFLLIFIFASYNRIPKRKAISDNYILFILILLFHFFLRVEGDDLQTRPFIGYSSVLLDLYKHWTSRLIIDIFYCITTILPLFVWYILNSLILVFLINNIKKIFALNYSFFTILFFILFPVFSLRTAGWRMTAVTYVWPLFFGIIGIIPVYNVINNIVNTKKQMIFSSLCLLIAGNQEQLCALLLGFFIFFYIYFLLVQKKSYSDFLLLIIPLLLETAFIYTCPGNKYRFIVETGNRFQVFNSFSLIDKLSIGFKSTLLYYLNYGLIFKEVYESFFYFIDINFIFIFIVSIFSYCSIKQNNKKLFILTLLPFFYSLFCTVSSILNIKQLEFLYSYQPFHFSNQPLFLNIIQLLIFFIIISIYIFAVFYLCDTLSHSLFILLLLTAGFLSRIIIGFSPTIMASVSRTFLYNNVLIFISMSLLLKYSLNKQQDVNK